MSRIFWLLPVSPIEVPTTKAMAILLSDSRDNFGILWDSNRTQDFNFSQMLLKTPKSCLRSITINLDIVADILGVVHTIFTAT